MDRFPKVLAAFYITAIAAIMVYAGGSSISIGWALGSLFFLAFAAIPQMLMIGHIQRAASKRAMIYYVVLQLILSFAALLIYVDGFFINSDAQSGLLFIFIPIYQILIIIVAALIQKILDAFTTFFSK